jgi:hypothetical protein
VTDQARLEFCRSSHFSNKPIVIKLDKLVSEFSSRGENAFVRSIEGHRSAADLEQSEICVALRRRLTIP